MQALPQLVLTANLAERPSRWRLVAAVPFGGGRSALGLVDDVHHASLALLPEAFAVASDGSLWFLDIVKRRLAHYTSSGAFLGEVTGLRFDRFSPVAVDVSSVGSDLYVLQQDNHSALESMVSPAVQGEEFHWVQMEVDGKPEVVAELVQTPTSSELIGRFEGYAVRSELGGGPTGVGALDVSRGSIRPLPGEPVGPGAWMDVRRGVGDPTDPHQDQRYDVTFSSAERTARMPLLVLVRPTAGAAAPSLPAEVGIEADITMADGIAAYVMLSPARPSDAERYGGGRWFLEITEDGSPMAWERLPDPGLSSEHQVRHLAVGPDGGIYLMIAQPDGMYVYRRPGP